METLGLPTNTVTIAFKTIDVKKKPKCFEVENFVENA